MVYSLKSGVWKKVQGCPFWLLKEDNGTSVGGALHWIATIEPLEKWSPLILVGLNLGSHITRMDVENPVLDHIHIWMMKDYGVKRSWVKLFSVEQSDGRL
ncbi:hypothetical protein K7X08_011785 [Anisodus acutangulus]|uniref:F-box protein n=1 Tax=Anisodus acutangulus TaxID=402998 RepID=A0A9Q1MLD8_9SOLA|nr:hypothetical protein K7X08_011785 [Anisodus acutangulus]